MSLWSFQGPCELAPAQHESAGHCLSEAESGLSKLNSVRPVIAEVDVDSRRAGCPTAEAIKGAGSLPE